MNKNELYGKLINWIIGQKYFKHIDIIKFFDTFPQEERLYLKKFFYTIIEEGLVKQFQDQYYTATHTLR